MADMTQDQINELMNRVFNEIAGLNVDGPGVVEAGGESVPVSL